MLSGEGSIDRLGELAKELGFSRTLLVADAGLVKAGHLEHARASLEAAAVDTIEFSDFGPNPDADMLEAGRASRGRQGHRFDHRPRRRQLARLREGDQFPADAGRSHSRFRRLRQSDEADAADDWRADDGRDRQRGAVVRDHFRSAHAQENGVRRSEGRVSRRHSRSAAHADAASVGDGGCRIRCHRARRRELRVHEAQRAIAGAVARGVAAARGELRARPCRARRSRGARRDAAGCVSRRARQSSSRCWARRTRARTR